MKKYIIQSHYPTIEMGEECEKERKSGSSQILTQSGKWWGRKPLLLVRSLILGQLIPEEFGSDFYRAALLIDNAGLQHRQKSSTKKNMNFSEFCQLTRKEKLTNAKNACDVMDYPEITKELFKEKLDIEINTLQELVQKLSNNRYGRNIRIGDSFCGGGSVPFEAAVCGADSYGSDLNPYAIFLTKQSINTFSKSEKEIEELKNKLINQKEKVSSILNKNKLEKSKEGWTAKYYLYCNEIITPDGWKIPLADSWVIVDKPNKKVINQLIPNHETKSYTFKVNANPTPEEFTNAKQGTYKKQKVTNPVNNTTWTLKQLRELYFKKQNISEFTPWDKNQFLEKKDYFYQQRLHAIQWYTGEKRETIYREPDQHDLNTEQKIIQELQTNWKQFVEEGNLPTKKIAEGDELKRPHRERGWSYWHHLFNPRQLLTMGLMFQHSNKELVGINMTQCERNSKCSIWDRIEATARTLSTQSLNTLMNWGCRASAELVEPKIKNHFSLNNKSNHQQLYLDANDIDTACDFWFTDPPYADAINYHELADFFLSWGHKKLPNWFGMETDPKSSLAVKGSGKGFIEVASSIYKNLNSQTLPNGGQILMFTHKDPKVWAQLQEIIVTAGLTVTKLWAVKTETSNISKKKGGEFVQATYLIICKPYVENNITLTKADMQTGINDLVREQIKSMKLANAASENKNLYSTVDYMLAAPTAVMQATTMYPNTIGVMPNQREKFQLHLQEQAEKTASNAILPSELDMETWTGLGIEEKAYCFALNAYYQGDNNLSMIQQVQNSYGVTGLGVFLKSSIPSNIQMFEPSELNRKEIEKFLGNNKNILALNDIISITLESDDVNYPIRIEKTILNNKLYLKKVLVLSKWIEKKSTTTEIKNAAKLAMQVINRYL